MTKNIDLVTNNYYEHELKYQDQINRINNTNGLKEKLKIETAGNSVIITYPKLNKEIKGEINFYKPNDAKSDFKMKVEPGNENVQIISSEKINKGLWRVKINWESDGMEFFSDEKVIIQ